MTAKSRNAIALISLAVLVFAGWSIVTAKDKKSSRAVLPAAATRAIKKAFPKAAIGQVERERESVVLYEVELEQDGREVEVEVTPGGRIVEVERAVTKGELPDAVAGALAKLAGDAKIKEIEKVEIHAAVKVVKLRKVRVVYEAEFIKDGKKVEVKIAENGKFLGKEVDDDGDDDEDDDGDNDEKEISLDQVPAAVKATILKEAGGKRIKEIEVETRGGKKIYEAEWVVGGKEVEIKVASDGKLLSKETEDDDDDD